MNPFFSFFLFFFKFPNILCPFHHPIIIGAVMEICLSRHKLESEEFENCTKGLVLCEYCKTTSVGVKKVQLKTSK